MTNEELSDLILSIQIAVKDDVQASFKTTEYKLPEAALVEKVIDALYAKFEHFDRVSVDGNVLTLVHPERED